MATRDPSRDEVAAKSGEKLILLRFSIPIYVIFDILKAFFTFCDSLARSRGSWQF